MRWTKRSGRHRPGTLPARWPRPASGRMHRCGSSVLSSSRSAKWFSCRAILSLKVLTISTRALLWLVLLVWLVFGAAWAVLHLVIVPRSASCARTWNPRQPGPGRAGAHRRHRGAFRQPVSLFELSNVQLLDREGAWPCGCRVSTATLSPRSLWNLGLAAAGHRGTRAGRAAGADGDLVVAGIEIPQQQDGARPTGCSRGPNGSSAAVVCSGAMNCAVRRCCSCRRSTCACTTEHACMNCG